VQVEGQVKESQLQRLRHGVKLNDGMARVVSVAVLPGKPGWLWSRQPPIRVRRKIPTSWLELDLDEGRNRQVRRMTAAVGLPALRLVRSRVGAYSLGDLKPGEYHREA
jgi:23S rRNA pseudouridine2457 synthase